uniref:Cysteine-rich venom protein n=1 Tax=Strigamia maritima TaxID=126957 RepID=T1II05_STRMM
MDMRKCRMRLVQTPEQLRFAYLAIIEEKTLLKLLFRHAALNKQNGNWKTVTTHQTFSTDDSQIKPLQHRFANLSIPDDKNEKEKSKKTHNSYRAKHGVPPLTLSKELCKYASEWAVKLAKEDKFQHRTDHKYGENIYMKWSSDPNYDIDGQDPVDDWYAEIKDHVFGKEPNSLKSAK